MNILVKLNDALHLLFDSTANMFSVNKGNKMNTSSAIELYATSIFGGLVMSVLTFNGMASAVALGTVIASSVITAAYVFARR